MQMIYDGVYPIVSEKSFVTFAENSGPPSEDISTGTPKVTKIRRKALHSPFETESFIPNLILWSSVQLERKLNVKYSILKF